MKLLGNRENAVFLAKMSLTPHFLFYHYHYLAAPDHRLLHPVEELEEAFLAPQNEPGRMSLTDEDATLAQTERTIARLHHGTRKGIKFFQTPELMTLALHAAKLAGFGERKRGRRIIPYRFEEKHLAGEAFAFSHHDVIFTRLQTATLALHRITNVLMTYNDTLAINYFLTKATNNGAMISTKTI